MLDVLESGLLAEAEDTGAWFAEQVRALQHPRIIEVRGRGMLWGIVFDRDIAAAVSDAALEVGFITNAPRPNVLRIAPPLIITPDELAPFVRALPSWLE